MEDLWGFEAGENGKEMEPRRNEKEVKYVNMTAFLRLPMHSEIENSK
jgi:hypothetical protein